MHNCLVLHVIGCPNLLIYLIGLSQSMRLCLNLCLWLSAMECVKIFIDYVSVCDRVSYSLDILLSVIGCTKVS